MSNPIARLKTDEDTGNIIVFTDTWEMEFTPDQAEQFAVQLLKRARPKEHCFVIPVSR